MISGGHNSRISHGFGAPYTPAGGYGVDPRHNQVRSIILLYLLSSIILDRKKVSLNIDKFGIVGRPPPINVSAAAALTKYISLTIHEVMRKRNVFIFCLHMKSCG